MRTRRVGTSSQDEWDKYLSAFGEYHESCNGDRANP